MSAIVEIEQLTEADTAIDTIEQRLQDIWRHTYAVFASNEATQFSSIFLRRGVALRTTIYPDRSYRRRLYRTGLRPSAGSRLIDIYAQLRPHLESGSDYSDWNSAAKLRYIIETIRQISGVPEFTLSKKAGRSKVNWEHVLSWWLSPQTATHDPSRKQISEWHSYVSQHFQYRFNWGLGAIIALATDEVYHGQLRLPSLSDWPQTGLPWIVFWLKELIVWGTLDPVAAYVLSHKLEITRTNAELAAQEYYRIHKSVAVGERLDATNIRSWANRFVHSRDGSRNERLPRRLNVELLRNFESAPIHQWRVIPVEQDNALHWLDPAGFPLARSSRPANWDHGELDSNDFLLDPVQRTVTSRGYLF